MIRSFYFGLDYKFDIWDFHLLQNYCYFRDIIGCISIILF